MTCISCETKHSHARFCTFEKRVIKCHHKSKWVMKTVPVWPTLFIRHICFYCPLPNKVQGLYIYEYVRRSVCPSKGFLNCLLEYDQTECKRKYMQMCTKQYSSIPKFQREMIEFLLITNDTGTGLSPQFLWNQYVEFDLFFTNKVHYMF